MSSASMVRPFPGQGSTSSVVEYEEVQEIPAVDRPRRPSCQTPPAYCCDLCSSDVVPSAANFALRRRVCKTMSAPDLLPPIRLSGNTPRAIRQRSWDFEHNHQPRDSPTWLNTSGPESHAAKNFEYQHSSSPRTVRKSKSYSSFMVGLGAASSRDNNVAHFSGMSSPMSQGGTMSPVEDTYFSRPNFYVGSGPSSPSWPKSGNGRRVSGARQPPSTPIISPGSDIPCGRRIFDFEFGRDVQFESEEAGRESPLSMNLKPVRENINKRIITKIKKLALQVAPRKSPDDTILEHPEGPEEAPQMEGQHLDIPNDCDSDLDLISVVCEAGPSPEPQLNNSPASDDNMEPSGADSMIMNWLNGLDYQENTQNETSIIPLPSIEMQTIQNKRDGLH